MQGAGGTLDPIRLRQGQVGGLLGCIDTAGTSSTGDDRTFIYAYDGQGNVTQLIETTAGASNGLSYNGYRYYSARLGRWLSRDPIGEAGGVNLYGFVGNDAINLFDALGHFPDGINEILNSFDCDPSNQQQTGWPWEWEDPARNLPCSADTPSSPELDQVLNSAGGGLQIAGGAVLAGSSLYFGVCALSGPPGWAVAAGTLAAAGICIAADQIATGYVQIEQGTPNATQLNDRILRGKCGLSPTQAGWAELLINLGVGAGQGFTGFKCGPRIPPAPPTNCLAAEQALARAADESFDLAASIPSVKNPRACRVGVSTRTGQSYRGVSGEFVEPCGTQLGGRLPKVSVEKHSVTRCAEVSVAARAEAAGECLDDLVYSTRSVRTAEIMDPCGNCRSWIAPGRCMRGTEAP